jgi:hypothetical protein
LRYFAPWQPAKSYAPGLCSGDVRQELMPSKP